MSLTNIGDGRPPGDGWVRTSELRPLLAAMLAVRDGDSRVRAPARGEGIASELATAFNQIADRHHHFMDELNRVCREVVRDGRLDARLWESPGQGAWTVGVEAGNTLINALVVAIANATRVLDAVADGDLTQRMDLRDGSRPLRGDLRSLSQRINQMVDHLVMFTGEVTRLAREVGTEGRLSRRAKVQGLSGAWRDVAEAVNTMTDRFTSQVREITAVTRAVAGGDLTRSVTIGATGELLELKLTVNTMVDQLSAFADGVNRVARVIGMEGKLGEHADVRGVSGMWEELADNVNAMADNLTSQVRDIVQVATAVTRGDLTKRVGVDACGLLRELKDTINTMMDTLCSFSSEVTRVAYEVGCEGRLGGQASVEGVHGSWERLTTNVNELARTLTTHVRAIAEVTSAVAQGDMSRHITVETHGELSESKDNINRMVSNLREVMHSKDWLESNLARMSETLRGRRDLVEAADLILRELAPLVNAQCGAFFLVNTGCDNDSSDWPAAQAKKLAFVAGYGLPEGSVEMPEVLAQGLVRQAAQEKRRILLEEVPSYYLKISSGLGESAPASIVVIPVLHEDRLLGVIELASLSHFSDVHLAFFDQFVKTIGVAINTILTNACASVLFDECRQLAAQLQERSDELRRQQAQLQHTNEELKKAALLASSSRYKSKFLADMSHELRTPLSSMLIYARLLADDVDGNLSEEEIGFATNIHKAGTDLLQLIDDILDLSKVEAGRLDIRPEKLVLAKLLDYLNATFRPITDDGGLNFEIQMSDDAPAELYSDEQRLQQILRNLLSNAIKFTPAGRVTLRVERPGEPDESLRQMGDVIAFTVEDTGIGIPPDKLTAIFDAFEQADDATSRNYGGTGLGLSISRELAALLGGKIVAESVPGKGSSFTLCIPTVSPGGAFAGELQPDHEMTTEAASAEQRSVTAHEKQNDTMDGATDGEQGDRSTAVRSLKKSSAEQTAGVPRGKALIVDDDIRIVIALTRLLERAGMPVLYALNGQAGIEVLKRTPDVSLVLMDIMMPVMDGYEAIKSIRSTPGYADLPIIALSASTLPENREKALATGANEYVQKPVADVDRLLEIAHDLLDPDSPCGRP